MNKKLIAVAIAGVFAAPAALAQSSVTISGFLKSSFDNHKITDVNQGSGIRLGNTSENRVTDHASRIIFNVVEDMGGGLQALGQFDLRFSTDAQMRIQAVTAQGIGDHRSPAVDRVSSGNNHVGLRSKQWGTFRFGRQDMHYGNSGDTIAGKGALWLHNSAVFDSVMRPGSTPNTIATLGRTPNLMWYESPNWDGFKFMLGYSTNPLVVSGAVQAENDLGTSARKGRGWTFNPSYDTKNWHVSWSHWDARSDRAGGVPSITAVLEPSFSSVNNERADSLRGHYVFPMGLRVGLAWNQSRVSDPLTGLVRGDRRAWALPVSYTTGPHTFMGTYTKAGDSKDQAAGFETKQGTGALAEVGLPSNTAVTAASGVNTGATLFTLAYAYDLSKRTSVSLNFAKLFNRASGRYSLFHVADTVMGGTNAAALTGEDHQMMGVVLRHAF